MKNFIKRRNGSVSVYSDGSLLRVEDCPCNDGRRHFVYVQGHLSGNSVLDYKVKASASVSGRMHQGVLHSSADGWKFKLS